MKKFLRKIFKKHKKYDIAANNKLIIIENGIERIANNELIPGLWVSIKGDNNTVKIEYPTLFTNSSIIIDSDNADIYISKTQYYMSNFSVHSRLHGGHKLFIDEDFYCNGANILLREENASVTIGKDCMFSSGIMIWTSDGHAIFDNTTKELLNDAPQNGVEIGNHVWVGYNVNILKNSKISDNSVVALGGIISKRFEEPNILLLGVNQVKKHNINWSRDFITDYKRREHENSL